MVFASILEHAEHCDFFASTSRNKKIALRACEQRKNLGSTSKRAKGKILRAVNRTLSSFTEQYSIPKIVIWWAGGCLSFDSPHVKESKTVLDSGFHFLDSGFFVGGTWIPDSGFRIPLAERSTRIY